MSFKTILKYWILQCMRLCIETEYYIKIDQAASLSIEKQRKHNAHTI